MKDTSRVLVICDAGGTYMPVGVTLEVRGVPGLGLLREHPRLCDALGMIDAETGTLPPQGRRSRSLVAIFKLLSSKLFTDVRHVKGGIREWCGKLVASPPSSCL